MARNPVDPLLYATVLNTTIRRRRYFFATLLIYIPALLITQHINPTNRAMGTVFGLWLIALIIVTVLAATCKCPRCGNYFHMHGMTLLILRRCLHCQLHINPDKNP